LQTDAVNESALLKAEKQLAEKAAELLKVQLLAAQGALYRLQGLLHPRGMIEICEKSSKQCLHEMST
jgi:hypothetical protein